MTISKKYQSLKFSKNDLEYFDFHEKRYDYLIKILKKYTHPEKKYIVLDIGVSFQTLLIRDYFENFEIDTLGFTIEQYRPSKDSIDHKFDLNYSDTKGDELKEYFGYYDIIIFAEVIEHLRTKPEKTLILLNKLLKKGGILVVQTPNAAFFWNRVKLFFGKNPYMRIRDEINNPGHFREYTIKELIEMANLTGFEVEFWEAKNYFNHKGFIKKLAIMLINFMPKTFKNGFSLLLKKR
jgi:2-polyprenyl-3-methyl-5-hydroxy-6-metoxy-1,4-benzoquinol methylase